MIVLPSLPEGRVLPVVTAPDAVLSTPSVEVDPTDPEVAQLAADLLATQRVSPGCVGLAAPQVGIGWRVFSLDVTRHPKARTVHGPAPLDDLVPSLDGLEAHLRRFVDAGISKFVLAPVHSPADWEAELTEVRDAALSLQT